MRTIFIFILLVVSAVTFAQPKAHSHNDYNHPQPFYTAYNAGFGSIEADIFLVDGQLFVAHDRADIRTERTLAALYLEPIQKKIDSLRPLLLLIDIKTAAKPTLDALLALMEQYKPLTNSRHLTIAISGNRPAIADLSSYPAWLFFDGRPNEQYPATALEKIALISDNYRKYSSKEQLESVVAAAHKLNKPFRFWASPDNIKAWEELIKLKADYINTDKIPELANFLSTYKQ